MVGTRDLCRVPVSLGRAALRATAALLLFGVAYLPRRLTLVGADSWSGIPRTGSSLRSPSPDCSPRLSFPSAHGPLPAITPVYSQWALLLAYCALLIGPASQLYRQVDTCRTGEDRAAAVEPRHHGSPLIVCLHPNETTRAIIDMYARNSVDRIPGPLDAAGIERVRAAAAAAPDGFSWCSLRSNRRRGCPWRARPQDAALPAWIQEANLRVIETDSVPYGRALRAAFGSGRELWAAVQGIVFFDLSSPRKSLAMAFLHQRQPATRIGVPVEHGVDRPAHRRCVVVVEHAAGAPARDRIEMLHRIPRVPPYCAQWE